MPKPKPAKALRPVLPESLRKIPFSRLKLKRKPYVSSSVDLLERTIARLQGVEDLLIKKELDEMKVLRSEFYRQRAEEMKLLYARKLTPKEALKRENERNNLVSMKRNRIALISKKAARLLSPKMKKLAELSKFDPMFNSMYNIRHFYDVVGPMLRGRSPHIVGMIDMDKLKNINDLLKDHVKGGTAVLRLLTDSISTVVRKYGGIAAVYGGDEFVFYLPTSQKTAMRVMREISREFDKNISSSGVGKELSARKFSATFSAGLFMVKGKTSMDDVLGTASSSVYKSKDAGRNTAVLINADGKIVSSIKLKK